MTTDTLVFKPILTDIIFKFLFGYQKNIKFTEYLLETLYNYKEGTLKGKLEIKNSLKFDKTKYLERGLETDITIIIDKKQVINLEAYTEFPETSKIKSFIYIAHLFSTQLNIGDKLNKVIPHLQINFVKGKNIKSREYTIIAKNDSNDFFINNLFQIEVINVDDFENTRYNLSEKAKRLIKFIGATTKEEAEVIIKGDEMLEDMYQKTLEFIRGEWAEHYFSKIYHDTMIDEKIEKAQKEAQKKTKIETQKEFVLKMLEKGYTKEQIKEISELSIEQIEELEKSIKSE